MGRLCSEMWENKYPPCIDERVLQGEIPDTTGKSPHLRARPPWARLEAK
jgi:hypothetical protein